MTFRNPLAWALTLTGLLVAAGNAIAQNEDPSGSHSDMTQTPQAHPVYYVMLHSPGPAWAKDIPFREQPGVETHVQYMAELLQQGLIVMGGPFLDDSGGMMISRSPTLEEAQQTANKDPAVQSGLLRVEVHPWMVPMATVD